MLSSCLLSKAGILASMATEGYNIILYACICIGAVASLYTQK